MKRGRNLTQSGDNLRIILMPTAAEFSQRCLNPGSAFLRR